MEPVEDNELVLVTHCEGCTAAPDMGIPKGIPADPPACGMACTVDCELFGGPNCEGCSGYPDACMAAASGSPDSPFSCDIA